MRLKNLVKNGLKPYSVQLNLLLLKTKTQTLEGPLEVFQCRKYCASVMFGAMFDFKVALTRH